jgi:hypothetical protein
MIHLFEEINHKLNSVIYSLVSTGVVILLLSI